MMRRAVSAFVAAATVLLAGCTGSDTIPATSTAPPPPDPYARSQFSIVWSDSAGLDLMSPEGTYVRASVESLWISTTNANAELAVPGFWDSLVGPAKNYVDGFFRMGPDKLRVGVKRFEVINASTDGDTLTATICTYDGQVGTPHLDAQGEPDETYAYSDSNSFAHILTIRREGATAPPADQTGPDTFITTPLLGSWKTLDWHLQSTKLPGQCLNRPVPGVAPGSWPIPPQRSYITTEVPSQKSFPGWSRGT